MPNLVSSQRCALQWLVREEGGSRHLVLSSGGGDGLSYRRKRGFVDGSGGGDGLSDRRKRGFVDAGCTAAAVADGAAAAASASADATDCSPAAIVAISCW